MDLCGFLAPNGEFIKCESWGHLDKANEICREKYKQVFSNRIKVEDYLFELGYVEFNARSASKRYVVNGKIILLSDEQKHFLEEHINDCNNEDQQRAILEILDFDSGYREDSILDHYESKILN